MYKSKSKEVRSRHVPERASVDAVGGDDCRGRRSGVVGGGEEAVAAERARGARADEPGVEAGAVEDVAAPELAHIGPVADGRQAEGALGVPRRALTPAVRREREPVAGLGRQRRLVVVVVAGRRVGVRRRKAVAEEGGARGRAEPAAAQRERGHAEGRLAEHQQEDEAGQGEGGEQRAAHLHGCRWSVRGSGTRRARAAWALASSCALLCSLPACYVEIRSAQLGGARLCSSGTDHVGRRDPGTACLVQAVGGRR
jgi:hypothetical protein